MKKKEAGKVGGWEAEGSKLKAQRKDSPPRVQRIQRGLEQIARCMGQREAEVGKRGRWEQKSSRVKAI